MNGLAQELNHAGVKPALYLLSEGAGRPLLLLHAHASSHLEWQPSPAWPGSVWALDFAGHGTSAWRRGGAYTPELFAADADTALARIGTTPPPLLVGRGLGAYVALLLAGGRPDQTAGAILLPGDGLDAYVEARPFEAPEPRSVRLRGYLRAAVSAKPGPIDPRIALVLEGTRPSDYSAGFAAAAARIVLVESDLAERPPWWLAVRATAGVTSASGLAAALASFPDG